MTSTLDSNGKYFCDACNCKHTFYEEGEKVSLLIGTSTMAGLRKVSDGCHYEEINICGGRISELTIAIKTKLKELCKTNKVDILFIGGLISKMPITLSLKLSQISMNLKIQ